MWLIITTVIINIKILNVYRAHLNPAHQRETVHGSIYPVMCKDGARNDEQHYRAEVSMKSWSWFLAVESVTKRVLLWLGFYQNDAAINALYGRNQLANTFQKVWNKPDKEKAFLQRLTFCCNQHVRQMFSTSSKPWVFQSRYLLVKTLQVCTGSSASSMQTTGDCDNLPLTKAIIRRFLVSHRIPLCYYLMLAATNNLHHSLASWRIPHDSWLSAGHKLFSKPIRPRLE